MALKLIQQDLATLRAAFEERKAEYHALRAAGRWAGAVLYAGTLLELALELVISKQPEVSNLPAHFSSARFGVVALLFRALFTPARRRGGE
ncbi:hypothetical protein HUU39_17330 [candidate division KSB1 bacterium]|nr:hypothetical protein [bacterium]NUM67001.1 hypothetical protein [candidate division KSB1 bacterium]